MRIKTATLTLPSVLSVFNVTCCFLLEHIQEISHMQLTRKAIWQVEWCADLVASHVLQIIKHQLAEKPKFCLLQGAETPKQAAKTSQQASVIAAMLARLPI